MEMVAMIMAGQTNKCNNVAAPTNNETNPPAVFHDFLGGKAAAFDGGAVLASPSCSGASSGARGPFSSTSDLASERQLGGPFERISCHGPKNELPLAEMSNSFVGSKRSNSDSVFMSSAREGIPQMIPESSPLMKMIRSASGRERPRISHYDGLLHGARQMRPVSTSLTLQPTTGTNANFAKSERSNPMNVGGSGMQYNACIGKASPNVYQVPSSRFRDGNFGPPVLSMLAADEGSRTGNKGSGILNSINAGNLVSERNPAGLVSTGCKIMATTHNSEPESSNPTSGRGLISCRRQMTIIYGGQVHVFDDLHPNKADVVMALAGSNGGSWSTTLPKSSAKEAINESYLPAGENETSTAGDPTSLLKHHKLLSAGRSSFHGFGSSDRGGSMTKNAGISGQATETSLEDKPEV